ncbi:hypothetical protein Tasa_021_045 [Tanticharoenia sakaeratensis NBRC 103193]|uniref:Uncharacterized protein n=1 Tax=Tanticharoenia sakaeratensis NBRC 103193 TaxID=1231623 RepID=A0A0D6MLB9_9PROT|nr:hypothetical protein Tasa_021_045 [Tanticharoenia sakaeratensis NBRC 103193]GBQ24194.1 hypothetical protein AA103193_2666 [Tanticharoenia sakaeratensis NBRC 103193]
MILKGNAEAMCAGQRGRRVLSDRDRALVRRFEAGHEPEHRALAATGRPEYRNESTGSHVEGKRIEGRGLRAAPEPETTGNAVQPERRRRDSGCVGHEAAIRS